MVRPFSSSIEEKLMQFEERMEPGGRFWRRGRHGLHRIARPHHLNGAKYGGMDISGQYRFTDAWVESNGRCQVVAWQGTAIQQH